MQKNLAILLKPENRRLPFPLVFPSLFWLASLQQNKSLMLVREISPFEEEKSLHRQSSKNKIYFGNWRNRLTLQPFNFSASTLDSYSSIDACCSVQYASTANREGRKKSLNRDQGSIRRKEHCNLQQKHIFTLCLNNISLCSTLQEKSYYIPFCFPRGLFAYFRAMMDKAMKRVVYTCEQTDMYMHAT